MNHTQGGLPAPIDHHLTIPRWPKQERPREKLIAYGANNLSEAELLAIMLRTGTSRMTALDVAKALLARFGSLRQLSGRNAQEFMQFEGLGAAKAIMLVAVFEIGRRIASHRDVERLQICSPEDVVALYRSRLRDLTKEVFQVVLLDSANRVQRDVVISEGILNSSLAHPREVFRPAILEPSASIILMHNHPSGNPEPSAEDMQITRQMVESSKIIGIPVHDHIIIAGDSYTSFAERGIL